MTGHRMVPGEATLRKPMCNAVGTVLGYSRDGSAQLVAVVPRSVMDRRVNAAADATTAPRVIGGEREQRA